MSVLDEWSGSAKVLVEVLKWHSTMEKENIKTGVLALLLVTLMEVSQPKRRLRLCQARGKGEGTLGMGECYPLEWKNSRHLWIQFGDERRR